MCLLSVQYILHSRQGIRDSIIYKTALPGTSAYVLIAFLEKEFHEQISLLSFSTVEDFYTANVLFQKVYSSLHFLHTACLTVHPLENAGVMNKYYLCLVY